MPTSTTKRAELVVGYGTDARWAAKGDELYWNGYKVHVTETCGTPDPAEVLGADVPEVEQPNLIVGV